jgi:hypothetical protein
MVGGPLACSAAAGPLRLNLVRYNGGGGDCNAASCELRVMRCMTAEAAIAMLRGASCELRAASYALHGACDACAVPAWRCTGCPVCAQNVERKLHLVPRSEGAKWTRTGAAYCEYSTGRNLNAHAHTACSGGLLCFVCYDGSCAKAAGLTARSFSGRVSKNQDGVWPTYASVCS